ncbi:hypothetical protein [Streptomyces sp. NPDC058613]|uniref:hypothetical protein n=1 Tax=Streptomyces sp. NPDC058613 TaxID=3346556 RepID=UPI00365C7472
MPDAVGPAADETGALTLGADGFPVGEAPAEGVRTASYISGLGTGSWAYSNTGVKWEYKYEVQGRVHETPDRGGGRAVLPGGVVAEVGQVRGEEAGASVAADLAHAVGQQGPLAGAGREARLRLGQDVLDGTHRRRPWPW